MKKAVITIVLLFICINYFCFAASYDFRSFSDISSDRIFHGMSPNGELLLGNASGSYLWSFEGGLTQLSEKNFEGIRANATYSGETISNGAGFMAGTHIATGDAVLWTPHGGSELLYQLMGIEKPLSLRLESVSANGVIVGNIANENEQGQRYYEVFSYNSRTGAIHFIATAFRSTSAYGVSSDGTTVTGTYKQQPFWWTQDQGIQFLQHPDIPFLQIQDDRVSEVFDVSDDGHVMVGWSGSPFESVAVIWHYGYPIILSDEENSSFATSVSGDGRFVVGHEYLHEAPNHRIAFIWDELWGKQYLNDVLTTSGVDLGGWHLSEALAISSDGMTIMGTGINPNGQPENWIVRKYYEPYMYVPVDIEPGKCPNRIIANGHNPLHIAICGSETLDVNDIDVASVNIDGVKPVRTFYRDVATAITEPPQPEEHPCVSGKDGIIDLVLRFEKQEVINTLEPYYNSYDIEVILTGKLKDGTNFTGFDCVDIFTRGKL